jgi:hypothetical protein
MEVHMSTAHITEHTIPQHYLHERFAPYEFHVTDRTERFLLGTPHAVVMHATRRRDLVPVASAGYDLEGGRLNCSVLKGVRGRYLELALSDWRAALLEQVIGVARDEQIPFVTLASFWYPEDGKHREIAQDRFERSARLVGFRYDEQLRLYTHRRG